MKVEIGSLYGKGWKFVPAHRPVYYEVVTVKIKDGSEKQAWLSSDGENYIWTEFATYQIIEESDIIAYKRHQDAEAPKVKFD